MSQLSGQTIRRDDLKTVYDTILATTGKKRLVLRVEIGWGTEETYYIVLGDNKTWSFKSLNVAIETYNNCI